MIDITCCHSIFKNSKYYFEISYKFYVYRKEISTILLWFSMLLFILISAVLKRGFYPDFQSWVGRVIDFSFSWMLIANTDTQSCQAVDL